MHVKHDGALPRTDGDRCGFSVVCFALCAFWWWCCCGIDHSCWGSSLDSSSVIHAKRLAPCPSACGGGGIGLLVKLQRGTRTLILHVTLENFMLVFTMCFHLQTLLIRSTCESVA